MSVNENQELNQPGDLNQPDESFAALEQSLTAALERVDESLSTPGGGQGVVVYYGMAKPVKTPMIGPPRAP